MNMSIQREALEEVFRKHFPRTKMSRAFVAFGEDVAALSAPTEQVPDVLPAEAITGFAAWLTCLERPVTFGSTMDAAPAADMVEAYRKSQGWDVPREGFASRLKRWPLAASPSAPTAVQPAADDDLDCGHGPLEWADTGDALTPTERAACQQCGSDPHKMSCTIGGKDQLRLTAVATPTAVKEAGGVGELPPFSDPRVKAAYNVLIGNYPPPEGEHWEGFAARNIVAELDKHARAAQPATPVAPTITFVGVNPLQPAHGAATPLLRDSWRFGFDRRPDGSYRFGFRDDGPFVLYEATPVAPIDMVLHCPACGKQHIDAPEGQFIPGFTADESSYYNRWHGIWDNPPHRSHKCHGCGHIWRPADVPTNGVAAVKTKGKADSPIATPVAPKTLEALTPDEVMQVLRKADCLGTVRLTTGTGPYDIDRTTVDTDVLTEYFTRALAAKNNMTLGAPDGN